MARAKKLGTFEKKALQWLENLLDVHDYDIDPADARRQYVKKFKKRADMGVFYDLFQRALDNVESARGGSWNDDYDDFWDNLDRDRFSWSADDVDPIYWS